MELCFSRVFFVAAKKSSAAFPVGRDRAGTTVRLVVTACFDGCGSACVLGNVRVDSMVSKKSWILLSMQSLFGAKLHRPHALIRVLSHPRPVSAKRHASI